MNDDDDTMGGPGDDSSLKKRSRADVQFGRRIVNHDNANIIDVITPQIKEYLKLEAELDVKTDVIEANENINPDEECGIMLNNCLLPWGMRKNHPYWNTNEGKELLQHLKDRLTNEAKTLRYFELEELTMMFDDIVGQKIRKCFTEREKEGDGKFNISLRACIEESTPTTQCNRTIGEVNVNEKSTCWICSYGIPENTKPGDALHPECEHVFPIAQALCFTGLYSAKVKRNLPMNDANNYVSGLMQEYGWSHRICNQIKNDTHFIKINSNNDMYILDQTKIDEYANNLTTTTSYGGFNDFLSGLNQYVNSQVNKNIIGNNVRKNIKTRYDAIINSFNEAKITATEVRTKSCMSIYELIYENKRECIVPLVKQPAIQSLPGQRVDIEKLQSTIKETTLEVYKKFEDMMNKNNVTETVQTRLSTCFLNIIKAEIKNLSLTDFDIENIARNFAIRLGDSPEASSAFQELLPYEITRIYITTPAFQNTFKTNIQNCVPAKAEGFTRGVQSLNLGIDNLNILIQNQQTFDSIFNLNDFFERKINFIASQQVVGNIPKWFISSPNQQLSNKISVELKNKEISDERRELIDKMFRRKIIDRLEIEPPTKKQRTGEYEFSIKGQQILNEVVKEVEEQMGVVQPEQQDETMSSSSSSSSSSSNQTGNSMVDVEGGKRRRRTYRKRKGGKRKTLHKKIKTYTLSYIRR